MCRFFLNKFFLCTQTTEGWQSVSTSCANSGRYAGFRYRLGEDNSINLLFDKNGIIAGIQALVSLNENANIEVEFQLGFRFTVAAWRNFESCQSLSIWFGANVPKWDYFRSCLCSPNGIFCTSMYGNRERTSGVLNERSTRKSKTERASLTDPMKNNSNLNTRIYLKQSATV